MTVPVSNNRMFVYSWVLDADETEITAIRGYGLADEGTICIRINNFTPFVYVELPPTISWNSNNIQMVATKIDILCGKQAPIKKKLVHKKRLYYAHLTSDFKQMVFPYLQCDFSNPNDIRALISKLRKKVYVTGIGNLELKVQEQDATPILKLLCCKNIPAAGWIGFNGIEYGEEEKITSCTKEYKVNWRTLTDIQTDHIISPLIMAFDIECNSSNPAKMPQADKADDKIFQISCCFTKDGEDDSKYEKILLTLGRVDNLAKELFQVREFKTESELLEGFTAVIQEKQPNVICGYNIFGFDYPYMKARADKTWATDFFKMGFPVTAQSKEKVIKWSSSAYKNQEFKYLDAEGRLLIDLLPLVRRDYKLDNYKLSTVASHFIGDTKDPLGPKGIFKCYRLGMKGGSIGERALGICGKYCVQDSTLVLKLMNRIGAWTGLIEAARVCNVNPFTIFTQGQQVRVYSQLYKFCMYNNIVVEKDAYKEKEENDGYVGAFVLQPEPGVYHSVIPFDFSSLYPSTIIAYNIDYTTLVTDEKIPDDMCHIMEWEDHIMCQHDPKIIRVSHLTAQIEANKIKIKELRDIMSKTRGAVEKEIYRAGIKELSAKNKPIMAERASLLKSKPKKATCAKWRYRFLKEPKGVIPSILVALLDARKATRAKAKDLSDDPTTSKTMLEVLDKRQLAYKVSANSAYGLMGVSKGYLPFKAGARTVTYCGRRSFELASTTIQENFMGKLIYGDTDSNYVSFPHIKTPQELWDWAILVSKEVSKLFPPPMFLDFEKIIYTDFLIITKKRYIYRSCLRDGITDLDKIGKKGVLLTRRDYSNWIRDVYKKTVMMIFERVDVSEVLTKLVEEFNTLCSGVISVKNFVITKSIGDIIYKENGELLIQKFTNEKGIDKALVGDYKVPWISATTREKQLSKKEAEKDDEFYTRSLPAQVQLAIKMRKRGQRVEAGSRLEFVVLDTGNAKDALYDKYEHIDYFIMNSAVLKLDFLFYLKLLSLQLDQILSIAYPQTVNFAVSQYKLRLQRTAVLASIRDLGVNAEGLRGLEFID